MQHLTFTVDGRCFAIPSSQIVEVIPPVAAAPVAGAPAWITGCIRFRGGLVPVMDLSRWLDAEAGTVASRAPQAPSRLGTRVIVVETGDEGGTGSRRLGMRVDDVLTLVPIRPWKAPDVAGTDQARPIDQPSTSNLPRSSRSTDACLGPIVVRDGRTIQLLEPRHLLPATFVTRLFSVASGEGAERTVLP